MVPLNHGVICGIRFMIQIRVSRLTMANEETMANEVLVTDLICISDHLLRVLEPQLEFQTEVKLEEVKLEEVKLEEVKLEVKLEDWIGVKTLRKQKFEEISIKFLQNISTLFY